MEQRTLLIVSLVTPLLLLAAYGLYQVNQDNQNGRQATLSSRTADNWMSNSSISQQLDEHTTSAQQAKIFTRRLATSLGQSKSAP